MARQTLRVINLGKRAFSDALSTQNMCRQLLIQKSLQQRSSVGSHYHPQQIYDSEAHRTTSTSLDIDCSADGMLLLVEHWPVFTAGLREKAFTIQDEVRLLSKGAQVFRTNRGGLATFHGPGQLVAYPIINLKLFNIGLRKYVESLERVLVDTCKAFNVDAGTTRDTGVWVQNRKIASIGVNAKRQVTVHGVALNCNTNLSWFKHITPCGLEGVEMTSLTRETGSHICVSQASYYFLQAFSEHFNCEIFTESDYIDMPSSSKLLPDIIQ